MTAKTKCKKKEELEKFKERFFWAAIIYIPPGIQ